MPEEGLSWLATLINNVVCVSFVGCLDGDKVEERWVENGPVSFEAALIPPSLYGCFFRGAFHLATMEPPEETIIVTY